MRIAVFSDIHGNLPALEAVLADIEKQSADEIWCGGDLGWGGPWARECIAAVRTAGWKCVKGNTDIWITGDPQTIDSEDARRRFEDIAGAHGISEDEADWLRNLPMGHSAPGSILLVHGTPNSPFVAPGPNSAPADFAAYEGRAKVVIYGHIHVAFVRRLADSTIVVNPGSVGMPKDSELASYLLVDIEGTDLVLQHRRVVFDREAALSRARQMGEPIGEIFLAQLGG
jgi:putative phosphoesterase